MKNEVELRLQNNTPPFNMEIANASTTTQIPCDSMLFMFAFYTVQFV